MFRVFLIYLYLPAILAQATDITLKSGT